MTDTEAVEVELHRVVDRLNSMPLSQAVSAADGCREMAAFIIDRTRELTDDIPPAADLPDLGPAGLGSMLMVVGRDYLAAVEMTPGTDVTPVLDRLTALRRSLP